MICNSFVMDIKGVADTRFNYAETEWSYFFGKQDFVSDLFLQYIFGMTVC